MILCPRWVKTVTNIGGIIAAVGIALVWIGDSKEESYGRAQRSWGGLGEIFRDASGQAEEERASIFTFHSYGTLFAWGGLLLWGAGALRWGYWLLFQRPRFKVLGYGPVAVPGSGFVFQPPLGWTVEEVAGYPLPCCFGHPIAGFRPNINFHLDDSPGGILDGLRNEIAETAAEMKNWMEISWGEFSTNQGRTGMHLIAQGDAGSGMCRFNLFVLQRQDGVKLHICCASPVDAGASYDSAFKQTVLAMELA